MRTVDIGSPFVKSADIVSASLYARRATHRSLFAVVLLGMRLLLRPDSEVLLAVAAAFIDCLALCICCSEVLVASSLSRLTRYGVLLR